ncbi:MAG: APC family permease [Candidatus Nanopelagicales bacterium]
MTNVVKRALVGSPMSSDLMGETLLPKRIALPVFCSDPLSSVAYATEQILLVLVVGGTAILALTGWVAAAVVALLALVVWSYRQTVYAYPNGGGAYVVSKDNLGASAALVAASALMVDYVLTVAVSVTAGVANVASAFPALADHVLPVSLVVIAILAVMNLRGVKEAGTVFAIPTYGFIASVFLLLGVGVVQTLQGHPPVAESAGLQVHQSHEIAGVALVLLLLRAFASGCTALTGVEAISNGVPFFRPPQSRNAALTLAGMGVIAITMFSGVTWLAMTSGAKVAENPEELGLPPGTLQPTVIAQLGEAVFGSSSIGFYLLQAFTAAVLILAANTAFNGFPILASILGRDGYLPKQLGRRGDRLSYSNGIILLTLFAGLLVYLFDASTTRLIQLYILGVFLSFTLSQAGMVIHWNRELRKPGIGGRSRIHRSRAANLIGAVMTAIVLVIVLLSKFTHGAWMVTIAIPALVLVMIAIKRHYDRVDAALALSPRGVTLPSRVRAVVLVSRLQQPAMHALALARATRPDSLVGLHVQTDLAESRRLQEEWDRREIPVPLVIVDSPYRDITRPALDYVATIRRQSPRDVVTVFVPEYVVTHWWQQALHNQSALRLKARLLFVPGVMVTSVPTVVTDEQPDESPDDARMTS